MDVRLKKLPSISSSRLSLQAKLVFALGSALSARSALDISRAASRTLIVNRQSVSSSRARSLLLTRSHASHTPQTRIPCVYVWIIL